MERESFENEEIGKIMNENFVCIKVDREERPDVDKVYMAFVQVSWLFEIACNSPLFIQAGYEGHNQPTMGRSLWSSSLGWCGWWGQFGNGQLFHRWDGWWDRGPLVCALVFLCSLCLCSLSMCNLEVLNTNPNAHVYIPQSWAKHSVGMLYFFIEALRMPLNLLLRLPGSLFPWELGRKWLPRNLVFGMQTMWPA